MIDRERHRVTVEDELLDLTPSEFGLLEALIRQPGRVFSRSELIDAALGGDSLVLERTIDVHIRSLRKKLGDRAPSGGNGPRRRLPLPRPDQCLRCGIGTARSGDVVAADSASQLEFSRRFSSPLHRRVRSPYKSRVDNCHVTSYNSPDDQDVRGSAHARAVRPWQGETRSGRACQASGSEA